MKPQVHVHLHVTPRAKPAHRTTDADQPRHPDTGQFVPAGGPTGVTSTDDNMQSDGTMSSGAAVGSLNPTDMPSEHDHIGPGITDPVEPPEFVKDFVGEHKTEAKMVKELATRSVEHLQKAHMLLQVHECQDDDTNTVRRLVKAELERRALPKL